MNDQPLPNVAFGIQLRMTTPQEGGRTRGLGPLGEAVFGYRPNWGFGPLDHPREQAGAPVLCWDRDHIAPGETVRAVIVPMAPTVWESVHAGDELVMYEGARVCGWALVLWRYLLTAWPLSESDKHHVTVGESGCIANRIVSDGPKPEVVSDRTARSNRSITHGTDIQVLPDFQPAIAERMAAARGAIPAEPRS